MENTECHRAASSMFNIVNQVLFYLDWAGPQEHKSILTKTDLYRDTFLFETQTQ